MSTVETGALIRLQVRDLFKDQPKDLTRWLQNHFNTLTLQLDLS